MSKDTYRITVTLTAPAREALNAITERDDLTRAAAINRALGAYDFLSAAAAEGAKTKVHYPDGNAKEVRFL